MSDNEEMICYKVFHPEGKNWCSVLGGRYDLVYLPSRMMRFNWSAMLLAPIWAFTHRMWEWGILFSFLILSYFFVPFYIPGVTNMIVPIIWYMGTGILFLGFVFIANNLYYRENVESMKDKNRLEAFLDDQMFLNLLCVLLFLITLILLS